MKRIRLGNGFTIFIIFFAAAMVEAFQTHQWTRILFWLVVGALFVLSDSMKKVH